MYTAFGHMQLIPVKFTWTNFMETRTDTSCTAPPQLQVPVQKLTHRPRVSAKYIENKQKQAVTIETTSFSMLLFIHAVHRSVSRQGEAEFIHRFELNSMRKNQELFLVSTRAPEPPWKREHIYVTGVTIVYAPRACACFQCSCTHSMIQWPEGLKTRHKPAR